MRKTRVSIKVMVSLLLALFFMLHMQGSIALASRATQGSKQAASARPRKKSRSNKTAQKQSIDIEIKVGTQTFSAKFYDNETSRELIDKMPMTVKMSDQNGNEKYHRFESNFTANNTVKPANIKAGEIMYWSSNTLVLFYDNFDNSYGGYVKLGVIEDVNGLKTALGKGDVYVKFSRAVKK